MKNFLLIFMASLIFVSCRNSNTDTTDTRDIRLLADSSVYSNNNIFSDTISGLQKETAPASAVEAAAVTSTKRPRAVRQNTARRSAPVVTPAPLPQSLPPVATPPVVNTPQAPSKNSGTGVETGDTGTGGNTASVPQVEKKKGWNKATQGAVIGGVAGAVGGAIISKKKGLGAVVGGVVGAAGGYIIGKKMDKKDNQLILE